MYIYIYIYVCLVCVCVLLTSTYVVLVLYMLVVTLILDSTALAQWPNGGGFFGLGEEKNRLGKGHAVGTLDIYTLMAIYQL